MPAGERAREADRESEHEGAITQSRRLRVLVVDDDQVFADLLRSSLRDMDVRIAATLGSARAALREVAGGFDAVLLDPGLGVEDGLALLPDLAGCEPQPAVLALSGNPNWGDGVRLAANDVAYVPKLGISGRGVSDLVRTRIAAHRPPGGASDARAVPRPQGAAPSRPPCGTCPRVCVGNACIDADFRHVRTATAAVRLTKNERNLAKELCAAEGPVPAEVLAARALGRRDYGGKHSVRQGMVRVRKCLGHVGARGAVPPADSDGYRLLHHVPPTSRDVPCMASGAVTAEHAAARGGPHPATPRK